ncbi:hypothetical protein [Streptomyces sp. NPDC000395]|uniref:hypothetical protein n=1 Tax=Streptomyces sp. NPDC000395 TaxID=3154252 RepID=UPI00336AD82F
MTDPGGFSGSLDTWRDASFLTPLGHLVSPEAPSGLAHGIATPGTSQAPDADTTVGGPETPMVSRVFDAPRSGGDAQPSGTPAVALQRVADSGAVEPLISAHAPAMRIRQLPTLPVAPAQGAVPHTETTPPSLQRRSAAPTPPRPHTVGLGEPLAGLPPTAQRTPAASTGAVPLDQPGSGAAEAEAEQTAVARPLLGDDPLEVRTADSGPVPPAPTPAAPRPGPPASAEPASAAVPASVPSPSAAHRPPVPIQRASAAGSPVAEGPPALAVGPVVPLVAQRSVPLFSGVRPPSTDGSSRVSPAAGPPVVPVRWSDPYSGPYSGPSDGPNDPPGATSLGTGAAAERAVGASGVPSAQRSVVSAAPPPPPSPSVSRSAAGVTAGPATPSGGRLVDAGAVAVAAGVARRMADGSVVFQPPPPSSPVPAPVQRDVETAEPATPEPAPEPPPEPPEGSEATAPAATAPPPGSEGGGGPPKVDDELVRALFAPLSRLLKAELRLERERAGFLINTRH